MPARIRVNTTDFTSCLCSHFHCISGTTTNIASLNGFNPIRKRSYTLVFRGRYQTTGTTGVARSLVSFLSY
jgi:hypothetical protein